MASTYSQSVSHLTEQLTKLPGVGQKTAERLAYHIVRLSDEEALELSSAIEDVKHNVQQCSRCALLSETDPCHICSDEGRDGSVVCVVEDSRDAATIDESGEYNGLFHVLCGRLAPLDGIEPEDLTVGLLVKRVREGDIKEAILATNPDREGDATASYVREALEDLPVEVTRLGRGLPTGSHLQYANAAIVSDALQERRQIDK